MGPLLLAYYMTFGIGLVFYLLTHVFIGLSYPIVTFVFLGLGISCFFSMYVMKFFL